MITLKDSLIALKIYRGFLVAIYNCSDVDTLIKIYKEVKRMEPQTEIENALYNDILALIELRVNGGVKQ